VQRAEPAHHASASHCAASAHPTESLASLRSGSWVLILRRGLLSKRNRTESHTKDQAGYYRFRGLDHFVITPFEIKRENASLALPNEYARSRLWTRRPAVRSERLRLDHEVAAQNPIDGTGQITL